MFPNEQALEFIFSIASEHTTRVSIEIASWAISPSTARRHQGNIGLERSDGRCSGARQCSIGENVRFFQRENRDQILIAPFANGVSLFSGQR